MSDPRRLLHGESDADALERALLGSLHDGAPSAADKAAIWQNVSAGIVAAGIVGSSVGVAASAGTLASAAASATGASAKLTAAGSVAASAASKGLLVKLGLLAVLGGVSVGGVALYRQRVSPVTNSTATAAPDSPRRATSTQAVRDRAAPPAEAVRAEAPEKAESCRGADCRSVAPKRIAPARSERAVPDQLARESALLTEARAALRGGDRATCERALARLTRTFPHGVLVQEREVLEIELLLARGESAEARARAARFVAQHPETPTARSSSGCCDEQACALAAVLTRFVDGAPGMRRVRRVGRRKRAQGPDTHAEDHGTLPGGRRGLLAARLHDRARQHTAENARCLAAPDDAVETDEPGPARATYDFTLEKSATYVLWGRIRSPSASSNRFWFQLDGGTWYKWRISVGDIWYWDDLHDDTDYGTPLTFALDAGAHQLVFADAVSGVELDRLYITADGDTPPGNDTPCSPPHSIELDGVCLPSCGAQRGRMCGASACAGLAHIAAYDCDVCCMGP